MGVQNSAAADDTAGHAWRKSSTSGGDNNNCVEAAFAGEVVLVRDTKDPARTIGLSRRTWRRFLAGLGEATAQ